MSESSASETAILLPTASVDIFIRDEKTIESARLLSEDWRYARVNVSVQEGDVETAIQSYQSTSSPDLIIIETETTDESFADRLEELSSYCGENTSAIVIGPTNDVDLYRKLVSMGVSDYLVRPVPIETLSEVVAKSLLEQLGTSGSKLITFIGSKGGVGTSSLTQLLAWGLSENCAQKTCLLDAAGGWSTMGVGMGFEPTTTLHEGVRAASNQDQDSLKRMLHKVSERLTVLASGAEQMLEASVHAQQYEELLDMLLASYPIVLADLSAASSSLKRTVINRAHEIIIVATPTLAALRAARSLMKEVKELRGGTEEGIDFVVNMQGLSSNKEISKKDIEAALEHKLSATIPFDPKLFVGSESAGKNIYDEKEGKDLLNLILPIVKNIVSVSSQENKGDTEGQGILGGVLKKISSK